MKRAIVLGLVGLGLSVALGVSSVACGSDNAAQPRLCGNGIVERGEQCDDGNTESGDGCSAACRLEKDSDDDSDAGTNNGNDTDAGGSDNTAACYAGGAKKKLFAGFLDGLHRSTWGKGEAVTGRAFAQNACGVKFAGSHVCTFSETNRAVNGLKEVPRDGSSMWLERTQAVNYKGESFPQDTNGGGHCEDWTYDTNHRSNGEWVSLVPVNTSVTEDGVTRTITDENRFFMDKTPIFDPNDDAIGAANKEPGMPCGSANGGQGRKIGCCFTLPEICDTVQ